MENSIKKDKNYCLYFAKMNHDWYSEKHEICFFDEIYISLRNQQNILVKSKTKKFLAIMKYFMIAKENNCCIEQEKIAMSN